MSLVLAKCRKDLILGKREHFKRDMQLLSEQSNQFTLKFGLGRLCGFGHYRYQLAGVPWRNLLITGRQEQA
ncbi:MAG: hypothetical protein WBQ69_12180 [Gallionella sp.]